MRQVVFLCIHSSKGENNIWRFIVKERFGVVLEVSKEAKSRQLKIILRKLLLDFCYVKLLFVTN